MIQAKCIHLNKIQNKKDKRILIYLFLIQLLQKSDNLQTLIPWIISRHLFISCFEQIYVLWSECERERVCVCVCVFLSSNE